MSRWRRTRETRLLLEVCDALWNAVQRSATLSICISVQHLRIPSLDENVNAFPSASRDFSSGSNSTNVITLATNSCRESSRVQRMCSNVQLEIRAISARGCDKSSEITNVSCSQSLTYKTALSQGNGTSSFGAASAQFLNNKRGHLLQMTFITTQCSRQLPEGRFACQNGILQSLP